MERTIHFGMEDVFDVVIQKPRYDQLQVTPGKGRGILPIKTQHSFEDEIRHLDEQIARRNMRTDDWKCRYDGHSYFSIERERFLSIAVGPTSYGKWREDYKLSEEKAAALQKLGEQEHQNKGFYLSNGLGAAVLTLTKEGDVVVGVRKSDSYDGAIHGAAGWMTFDRDVSKIDPVKDAYRELGEELAISRKEVSALHLIGLVAYPKTLEADFVFVAKTDKEKNYFTSGAWKDAVDAKEHRDLIVLDHPQQIERLLGEGKVADADKKYEVLASTAYGLEMLALYWDRLR